MTHKYRKMKTVLTVAIVCSTGMIFSSLFVLQPSKKHRRDVDVVPITLLTSQRVSYDDDPEKGLPLDSDSHSLEFQIESEELQGRDLDRDGKPAADLDFGKVFDSRRGSSAGSNVLAEANNASVVQQNGTLGMKDVQPDKFRYIKRFEWANTSGGDIGNKLEQFGAFLTGKRSLTTAVDFFKSLPEEYGDYTDVYEGDSSFFSEVSAMKNAAFYFLPWTDDITNWLNMDYNAKAEVVSELLPVKKYHPAFLSDHFIAKTYGNDSEKAKATVPGSAILRSQANISNRRINTFFFGYHGVMPHRPRFRFHMDLAGGWNLTKDCSDRRCTGFPEMLTYLLVLKADKYQINLDSNGRIHIPDARRRLVMSCCFEEYVKPKNPYRKYVYADELFDLTQNKIKATHHGLVESLTKLALFAPFLRQNPTIQIHFTENGYSKVLMPIFMEMLNLHNPLLVHQFHQVEAKVVYVPPGAHCFRGGDLASVQLTAHLLHQWTERKFSKNTTRDIVIILKRSSRHISNYDEVYGLVQSHVRQSGGKLQLYEFNDQRLPPVDVMIQLFYRAQAIFGAHGAGLTNLIFARPETHLVEVMCPSKNPVFKEMAYRLGLSYYPSVSVGKNNCFVDGPMADIADLQQIVAAIFKNVKQRVNTWLDPMV